MSSGFIAQITLDVGSFCGIKRIYAKSEFVNLACRLVRIRVDDIFFGRATFLKSVNLVLHKDTKKNVLAAKERKEIETLTISDLASKCKP